VLLASITSTAVTVVEVVIGIGLLIFIHELGHFVVAKLMNVRILKFSLGFGKRLVGFRRGETEYVVGALPLGGYVKFAGENPGEQRTTDPRALVNQSVGRRALIFVAGVVMNIIGALVMFAVAFGIGVQFRVPKVGQVVGGPAHEAGLRAGDEIVEINGHRDLDFEDIQTLIALSDPDRDLHLVVRRDGERKTFTLKPRLDERLGDGFPTIGITPPVSTTVAAVADGSAAADAGIVKAERILAVQVEGDPEVRLETFADLARAIRDARDTPIVLEIEAPDGTRRRQRLRLKPRETYAFSWELGRPVIGSVRHGGPAEAAGLRSGDVILTADGQPVVSVRGFVETIAAHGDGASPVSLTVRRGGETVTVTVTPRIDAPGEPPRIGIALGVPREAEPEIVRISPDSSLRKAEIPVGSVIVAVSDEPCRTVENVQKALEPFVGPKPAKPSEFVRVTLRTPDGDEITKEIQAEREARDYELGIAGEYETHIRRHTNIFKACAVGVRKTVTTVRRVLLMLRRIVFTRSVKPGEGVAGPVQIPVIAYERAKSGLGDFLYFLAILGANLAVINLLPIPILDGGQLVFLGIEKVKGSPLSERAQVIAQYAGLAVILLIFLYIAHHDVLKLIRFFG